MRLANHTPISARKKKIQVLETEETSGAPISNNNKEDDMTVEQYLRRQCQKEIELINAHVDMLVQKLQSDAHMKRLDLLALMKELDSDDE